MALTKYILPALSVAATAYAQCSSDETLTITRPQDVPTTCSTYTGDIEVQTGAANAGTVDFSSMEMIDGSFTYAEDNSVQQINFGSLQEVTGDFVYRNLSMLSNTGLSRLTTVGGELRFEGMSGLSNLGLEAPLESVGNLTIINTHINTFDGAGNVTDIGGLSITDNQYLGMISMDISEINSIEIGVNRENNGGQMVSFPNLESAISIVIRNSSSVDLGSLSNITASLSLVGNTFENFSAPALEGAGGLAIQNNGELQNLSIPNLSTIMGTNPFLQITNNSVLDTIALDSLTVVDGAVDIVGNFSAVSFNALSQIVGRMTVSTLQTFNCDELEEGVNGIVEGITECSSEDPDAIRNADGSAAGEGGSDEGLAPGLSIPTTLVSSFAALAMLMGLFM